MAKIFGSPLTESVILGKVDSVTSLRGVKNVLNDTGKMPMPAVLNILNKLEKAVEHRQCFSERKRKNAVNAIREYRIAMRKQ